MKKQIVKIEKALVNQKVRIGLTGAFARLEEVEDILEIVFYNNYGRRRKHIPSVEVEIGDWVEVGPNYVKPVKNMKEKKMKFTNEMVHRLPNGLGIVNTTPHAITFGLDDGNVIIVPECGILVNATIEEYVDSRVGDIEFIKSRFDPDPKTMLALSQFECYMTIFVGSIIAAQAYPRLVHGLVSCKGFERVPPEQKRMRIDKFVIF